MWPQRAQLWCEDGDSNVSRQLKDSNLVSAIATQK